MMSQPVTPQRVHRPAHSHSVSHSQYYHSPETPLSLRSVASSNASPSPLATPASAKKWPMKNAYNVSPLVRKGSYADVAQNWRRRASESGIRVADDEPLENYAYNPDATGYSPNEKALLPTPFHSNGRRRAVSVSQSQTFPSTRLPSTPMSQKPQPVSSPLVSRTLNYSTVAATPPPNRVLAAQHKLQGSFTDPPKPRQRNAFAALQDSPNISRMTNPDVSLDLFDIDENEYEYEDDERGHLTRYNMMTEKLQQYAPYPLLSSTNPPSPIPSFGQPTFADPFINGLGPGYPISNPMTGNPEAYFDPYSVQLPPLPHSQPQQLFRELHRPIHPSNAIHAPPPQQHHHMLSNLSVSPQQLSAPVAASTPVPEEPPTTCSVCSRSNSTRLAILHPCRHPLCSACLTSALNIVGEKDMECAVCKASVIDFNLISITPVVEDTATNKRMPLASVDANGSPTALRRPFAQKRSRTPERGVSFFDPMFSSPGSTISAANFTGLDNAFEILNTPAAVFDHDATDPVHCRTPPPPPGLGRRNQLRRDPIVIRIDNVPWDITPTAIESWLQQPVIRAHVLLDKKGKTLSHAFVEVESEEIAGAILRGEAAEAGSRRGEIGQSQSKGRGAVLGRGRRARGVTVTRSSQEELMAGLFPSWRGSFDGCRPTLAGLDNGRVIGALECGLLTEAEVTALLYLIRSPDAHFLKVPSLPFSCLISILSKFPSDVDSRVFWTSSLRDSLYDVTYAAIQVLLKRIEEETKQRTDAAAGGDSNKESQYNMNLVEELVKTSVQCQAFTTQQTTKLSELLVDSQQDNENNYSSSNSSNGDDPRCIPTDADVEDEGDGVDDDDKSAASSVTAASINGQPSALNDSNDADEPNDTTHPTTSTQDIHEASSSSSSYDDLAREFGVKAELVEAITQRLAKSNMR